MKQPIIKINHVGLKTSLFHDMYYKVQKTSWTMFFLWAAIFYILLNFVFALFYFLSPAEILNARPDSIWDAFIFSFQTSSTLGYGYFLPASFTAHAIVILDTISGIFYVAIVTGLAFSKFSRPQAKVLFSDKIILTTFDKIPTLMFRVANSRQTHIIDATLNVAALVPYTSSEGHTLRRIYKLPLISNNNPMFSLSWTVMHQLNEESPLYGLQIEDIEKKSIMIFASFTGIDDVLSQTIHSNTRFQSHQIIKANKFVDILSTDEPFSYSLDFRNFHNVE